MTRRSIGLFILSASVTGALSASVTGALSASVTGGLSASVTGGVSVSRAQQAPSRDATIPRAQPAAASAPVATSRLAGRVVTADEPARPIGRAIVTATADQVRSRSVIANDDGTFVIGGVPAARWTIKATRPGYLDGAYGAPQPLRAGTPVSVAAGEQRDGLTIRLTRGGVIAGMVRDEFGQPVPGLGVVVAKPGDLPALAPRIATALSDAAALTDDRGMYRIFGLAPGNYYLVIGRRSFTQNDMQARSPDEIDAIFTELRRGPARTLDAGPAGVTQTPPAARRPVATPPPPTVSFAPIFYPGASNVSDAVTIALAAGEERTNVDLTFTLTRTAKVSGTIVNPSGAMPNLQITLAGETSMGALPTTLAALQKAPGADGAFVYTAVTPGRYTVMVRTSPATPPGGLGSATLAPGALPPGPPNSLFGVADFTAAGTDIDGLTITLQPALHLTGRVVVDGAAAVDMGRLRVSLAAPNAGSTVVMNGVMSGRFPIPAATVKADGAFDMTGVIPGGYQLGVTLPPDTKLWLRSAMLGTRDLLDGPLDVSTDVSNVTVTLTDRHTELNGRLETPAGQPATDYVVIVFSADRSHWRPQARRLVSARPATDGRFIVRDLPPGDYFIAALTDLDPDAWQTSAFLDQVVTAAIKIAVGEGETKTQNLRIAR